MRDYKSSSRVTVLLSKFSLPGAASQLSAGKSQSAESWASPTDWLRGMTKRRDAVFENKFLFLLTFVCLLRAENRHSSLLAASWFRHNWEYSMTNHLSLEMQTDGCTCAEEQERQRKLERLKNHGVIVKNCVYIIKNASGLVLLALNCWLTAEFMAGDFSFFSFFLGVKCGGTSRRVLLCFSAPINSPHCHQD